LQAQKEGEQEATRLQAEAAAAEAAAKEAALRAAAEKVRKKRDAMEVKKNTEL
jgi:hypothetical protein